MTTSGNTKGPSPVARMRAIVAHISADKPLDTYTEHIEPSTVANQQKLSVLSSETRWNGWGYIDTKLFVNANKTIEISGERYAEVFHASKDRTLPLLLSWAEKTIGLDANRKSLPTITDVSQLKILNAPADGEALEALESFLHVLRECCGLKTSTTVEDRVRHSHGQTCEEIYQLRYMNEIDRLPDAVVWPQSHAQVESLVKEATKRSATICLIPHGGGTNVSNALECNPNEKRAIVSVDMRDMNRILHVDKENMTVRVEAGITGLDLHERLKNKGLTLGHEPDSWEFSTLGGWVATRASGMKKNIYGNIEDLVVNVKTVTPQGTMERSANVPRVSMGPDVTQFVLGSEGILGVFTEVTLRVRGCPRCQVYDSIVFPDFEHGIAALHEAMQEKCVPASLRLMDNTQFLLGQALKPSTTNKFTAGVIDFAKKTYVTKLRGFDPSTMCAATVLMEGTQEEVASQQTKIRQIAKKHLGLVGGEENGKRGYFFTYIIAYLRDFALDYYFMSESFETALPWTNIRQMCVDIKHAINRIAAERNVTTAPLIACRISQVYDTGVCLYVYYGINYFGVKDPLSLFKAVEHVAVDAIVRNGGSLSHHHGIGKHRREWLPAAISAPAITALQGVKKALDPTNVFASGNLLQDESG